MIQRPRSKSTSREATQEILAALDEEWTSGIPASSQAERFAYLGPAKLKTPPAEKKQLLRRWKIRSLDRSGTKPLARKIPHRWDALVAERTVVERGFVQQQEEGSPEHARAQFARRLQEFRSGHRS